VSTWSDIDERDDHYLGLAGANVVATEALLVLRDNLADVVAAKAMMCVHGDAGLGKTLSVNASLRALAPADVCRVLFRARPTPRDIRHVLFDALAISVHNYMSVHNWKRRTLMDTAGSHAAQSNGPRTRICPGHGPFSQAVAGVGFEPT
jgi:hypothetical protein